MRPSPSIIPGIDRDTYLVLDDYGRVGRAWAETDEDHTSLDAVISDLLTGQYSRPLRVISFNTAEGWSRDVSEDVASSRIASCRLRLSRSWSDTKGRSPKAETKIECGGSHDHQRAFDGRKLFNWEGGTTEA